MNKREGIVNDTIRRIATDLGRFETWSVTARADREYVAEWLVSAIVDITWILAQRIAGADAELRLSKVRTTLQGAVVDLAARGAKASSASAKIVGAKHALVKIADDVWSGAITVGNGGLE